MFPEKVKMPHVESSSNEKYGVYQLGVPAPIVPYFLSFHVPDRKTLAYISI